MKQTMPIGGTDPPLWAAAYGKHPGPGGDIWDGDYNDDGLIDGLDHLLWAAHYGGHSTMAASKLATAEKLGAVDAALENDFEVAARAANDATIDQWQLSWAFDEVFGKAREKRKNQT